MCLFFEEVKIGLFVCDSPSSSSGILVGLCFIIIAYVLCYNYQKALQKKCFQSDIIFRHYVKMPLCLQMNMCF